MECLGGMKPYKPLAFCLGKQLYEIAPEETEANLIWSNNIRTVLMNKCNYSYFTYKFGESKYNVRMVYLAEDKVLAVVQNYVPGTDDILATIQ